MHTLTYTPLLKILSCGRKGLEYYMKWDIQIAYLFEGVSHVSPGAWYYQTRGLVQTLLLCIDGHWRPSQADTA